MSARKYKSVTELFSKSRVAVRRNLYLFLLINSVAIINIAWQIGTNLRDKTHGSDWSQIISNTVLGSSGGQEKAGPGFILFVLGIAGVVFYLMGVILSLRAAQKEVVNLSDVWDEFKSKALRLIGVILLAGVIILAGLIALVIPGVYFLGRLLFAPYVLVDQNTGVREALNRSWNMTKGWVWSVLSVVLFGIVLSLPNVIPIIGPIIAFVLTLFYSVAVPLRYMEVKHAKK